MTTIMIPLTQGQFALVDSEDFERVNEFKWHATMCDGKFYAKRHQRIGGGKTLRIFMHRFILDTPKGMVTDHKNGNGLDNRRENLRVCTPAENGYNAKNRVTGLSPYKGVSPAPKGKWRAAIARQGERTHLGTFDNEIEAAKAYDNAAILIFKDFAYLNFPVQETQNGI